MQLAKGARLADALHADATFDVRTNDTATALLTSLSEVGGVGESDVELDAYTLVTPYTEQLDVVGAFTEEHVR